MIFKAERGFASSRSTLQMVLCTAALLGPVSSPVQAVVVALTKHCAWRYFEFFRVSVHLTIFHIAQQQHCQMV